MSLRSMNEAFKRRYSPSLEEQVDTSAKGEMKKCLTEAVKNINQYDLRLVENAMQSAIESINPDKSWWEVTNCNITESLFNEGVEATINTIVEGIKDEEEECVDGRCEQLNEISNPEKTISKIDKNLAKAVDKDMVRDLTLIIENDGDVYRRFTTPVIANLKRKRAKGNFDDKLAIQAFVHVVENALRQPYFYRYYSYDIKSVPVSVRYAVAKELLDGAMDEIEFEEVLQTSNPKKDRLVEEPTSGKRFVEFVTATNKVINSDTYTTDVNQAIKTAKDMGADNVIKVVWENGVDDPVSETVVWSKNVILDTNKNVREAFDDMEPEVWDYPDADSRYSDTYSYSKYDNAHNEIADRIRRKGYIGSANHSDSMTPINLRDKSAPKFNHSYLPKKGR